MIRVRMSFLFAVAVCLSACDMAPKYLHSASSVVPEQWPAGAAYAPAQAQRAGLPWRTLVADAKLRIVIERALTNNQDLVAVAANVASARASYGVQRANRVPTITADAGASLVRPTSGANQNTTQYSASVGTSAFEIDLFGRMKNLSRAAFERYLATESGARSARFSVVAETASAFATLAANQDLLAIAKQQVASSERTVQLNEELYNAGLVAGSDLADAQTLLAQAQSDVENYTTLVAQARNRLELVVGSSVEEALLPISLETLDVGIGKVPAGLSSSVLLDRPDVVEAEHQLKATYKDVGAARAAFFPTISLTSALGVASGSLMGLFSGNSTTWAATPGATLPLLGGASRGNLAYAEAQRDYYLALYRKAAQTAYREMTDGLARAGTIERQRTAHSALVAAAEKSYAIADARYREGVDSFLSTLVGQRTLYSARQTMVAITLTDILNRITLYQTLGSDGTL